MSGCHHRDCGNLKSFRLPNLSDPLGARQPRQCCAAQRISWLSIGHSGAICPRIRQEFVRDSASRAPMRVLSCSLCNKICVFRICTIGHSGAYRRGLIGILSQTFQARPFLVPGFFFGFARSRHSMHGPPSRCNHLHSRNTLLSNRNVQ